MMQEATSKHFVIRGRQNNPQWNVIMEKVMQRFIFKEICTFDNQPSIFIIIP